MAQQAGMSTEAFEDFYFRVCLLDYKALKPAMNALGKLMTSTDRVHIVGPGTDLEFSIKGIPAIPCGGECNIPDGECFTAPVRNSVNGVITHNAGTIYHGIPFDGIRLEFEKGKIVKAEANGKDEGDQQDPRCRRGRALHRRIRAGLQSGDPRTDARHSLRREDRGLVPLHARARPTTRPATGTSRRCTGTW